MEEFIFGTLVTDELKLVNHRAARLGIYHGHELAPRDPVPGQPVTLTARLGPRVPAERVVAYYTTDGSEPAGSRGQAQHGMAVELAPVDVGWDTMVWSYLSYWRGELPGQPDGTTVRYRIGAWSGDGPERFADWPNVQDASERAASAFFKGHPIPTAIPGEAGRGDTFMFRVDRLAPPQWARRAVIYQVFIDRFYPGEGCDWLQTTQLETHCGGTLWGVCDKMDYIADLGVDCIWLSPIFASPSHHGYDATDLYHVEPRLGGDAALAAVVQAAHARDIRVLLDYACNHISDRHPVFRAALSDPHSPYRAWFTFDGSEIGYRTFFDMGHMPQVNTTNPYARRWIIDVARYWLRAFDVDGYRLDYANGPGPDFWPEFWAACKAEKPDCFCFGEIISTPDLLRTYEGRLDGCLDFPMSDMLRRTFGWGSRTEAELQAFMLQHYSYFPPELLLPVFLDNHDMDRMLSIAGNDKEALRRAAALQMSLPVPVIMLYGTEVGLTQGESTRSAGLDAGRVPMAWGTAQDHELLAYYRGLIRGRKAEPPVNPG